MKSFFKNKKVWAFGGVFSLGIAAFAGFSYYKGWFGTDFSERTPQSKTKIIYQAAQDIVTKLRKGTIKSVEGENLQGAYLRKLDIQDGNFTKADLRRADLKNSKFHGTDFYDTNFERAKLQNVVFDSSPLKGTNFKKARMQGVKINTSRIDETTDFRGAKFQGADLSQAVNLEKAQLKGAVFDASTKLPARWGGSPLQRTAQAEKAIQLGMIKR